MLPGESTPTKIGDRRKEVRCFHRELFTSGDENLVPIDAHVGNDAHFATRAQKLTRKIDDDGLRSAYGDADVFDNRLPAPAFILHLESRQRQALSALRRSKVVTGPRVIGPTRQQQNIPA